jgi:hypothetical protein
LLRIHNHVRFSLSHRSHLHVDSGCESASAENYPAFQGFLLGSTCSYCVGEKCKSVPDLFQQSDITALSL